jgi:hypothetical protein
MKVLGLLVEQLIGVFSSQFLKAQINELSLQKIGEGIEK